MPIALLSALARCQPGPVLPLSLNGPGVARLDFSAANRLLTTTDLRDTAAFGRVVAEMLHQQRATIGVGGYLENRAIYQRSPNLFGAGEPRTLHLGVDIWLPAGTPVLSPLPARVHSVGNNAGFGNYGPTVILEHELEGITFYSLYGHLAHHEWAALRAGQVLAQGQAFATVGAPPENGDWPAHLHFQLMSDMQGRQGDFPGVAAPSEREFWAIICPDPNLILRIADSNGLNR